MKHYRVIVTPFAGENILELEVFPESHAVAPESEAKERP